ncbi:MAG: serine/threonine-protein kinase [Acidobacteriota bacterium]
MTPKDWLLADEIVQGALDVTPEEWPAFLDRACAARPDLRPEVDALLRADSSAEDFLDQPLVGEAVPPIEQWLPGGRVGPYRLIREIGFGGWSRVYLAERDDEQFERRVAVKVVDAGPSGDLVAARFRVERQILAGLEHPSIARLLDGGETADGRLYFVLEHVDGTPVDRFVAEAGLEIEARLRLMLRVCDAVAFAHEHLIVHRDLKPGNLLVTADGSPKLLDFGIAKVLEPSAFPQTIQATRTGHRPMTPAYAAPEQVRGGAITTATDVYALGLMLYEWLTGRRAYDLRGMQLAEIERTVCEREPPRPSQALAQDLAGGGPRQGRSGHERSEHERSEHDQARQAGRRPVDATPSRLAGDLDDIVATALAKDPTRRYRTARHFAEDLRRHLDGEPVSARTVTWWYRTERFVHRHRLGVASAFALCGVLVTFVVLLWVQSRQLEVERDVARFERDSAEAVTTYLVETFAEADPERSRGRDVSAREMLDRGLERLGQLSDQPAAEARLLTALGKVYAGLGAMPEAVDLLERARDQVRSIDGSDPLWLARVLHELGKVLLLDDRFEQAEPAILEALEIRRSLLGLGHRDTAFSLALHGDWMAYRGFYDEANETISAALEAFDATGCDRDRFELEKNRAVVLGMLGRPADAESRFDQLVEQAGAEGCLGTDHPLVLDARAHRAQVVAARDRMLARNLIEEVLADQQRVLGSNHPDVARTLSRRTWYLATDEPERAIDNERQALAINRRIWNDESWVVSMNHGAIGVLLDRLGRSAEAEEHFRRAAESADASVPATHMWRTRTKMLLARYLLRQGRFAEAEPLLREGAHLHRHLARRNDFYDGFADGLIGLTAFADGRYDEAAQRLDAHGETVLKIVGADSIEGRQVETTLATLRDREVGS